MKQQMAEMAEELIRRQEKKMEMKMEADKLLLSSVEQIEVAIKDKFQKAQDDLDNRMLDVYQSQLKQKEEIENIV
jgi:hypothetical protein